MMYNEAFESIQSSGFSSLTSCATTTPPSTLQPRRHLTRIPHLQELILSSLQCLALANLLFVSLDLPILNIS